MGFWGMGNTGTYESWGFGGNRLYMGRYKDREAWGICEGEHRGVAWELGEFGELRDMYV